MNQAAKIFEDDAVTDVLRTAPEQGRPQDVSRLLGRHRIIEAVVEIGRAHV